MTQNDDPTDNALAAIASILDHKDMLEPTVSEPAPEAMPEIITIVAERTTVTVVAEPEPVVAEHESPATVPEPSDVNGYTRAGPGPLDAIRFHWTARRDEDGQYFVDETIGTSSRPITSGPMPRDEVIDFIEKRERAAKDRFDTLKNQMTLYRPVQERENFGEF